jgi:ATP-dependent Zn protease
MQVGGVRQDVSPETAELIDRETRGIVEAAEQRAAALLQDHIAALHEIARGLQTKEVINGEEVAQIAQTA